VSEPSIVVNAAIVGRRPTGLGVYAVQVIRALARLGSRLVVFTSRPDLVADAGVETRPVPAGLAPEHGALAHARRLVWIQTAFRARVRREGAGTVLNLMPEGLLAPALPQITVVHDLLPLRYPSEYPRQQYYFRHYVPLVLRHSRAVVAISESTRHDVLRFYPATPAARVHVALSGYDPALFRPEPGPSPRATPPYALYLGNVLPHKNLDRMVDAFAAAARGTDARLVMRGAGRARHVEALRARIERLGLRARTDWQPYSEAAVLPELYRRARVLLLPSLYEGFGLTALEAMACGTPVITSLTSSMPEVVGDAALLVDPLDTAAIAEAMRRLFSDDALAEDLRVRGLSRAKLFSWETTGRAVQTAVREAAG
jgi:glycosyltransferase involved in cell wall biosynthesis